MSQDVTIVIPTHSEHRFGYLTAAVAAARAQTSASQVTVVTDHNDRLNRRIAAQLPDVTVLANQYDRGVSGTRNTGAFAARTPLIAFLDDDTVARPDWLERLVSPLADPAVVGTGGSIRPLWPQRPRWVPDEFLWAYGASYAGMPTEQAVVRNVWSASMAVRRAQFCAVGGFRVGFGKVGDRSRPEDTELCLRMATNEGHWVYVPDAVIEHRVDRRRSSMRYFLSRCYHEGRGKVELARLYQHDRDQGRLSAERDYLRRTVPRAILRDLIGNLRGADDWGAARAGAALAAVAAAGVGAIAETAVSPRLSPQTELTRQRVPATGGGR